MQAGLDGTTVAEVVRVSQCIDVHGCLYSDVGSIRFLVGEASQVIATEFEWERVDANEFRVTEGPARRTTVDVTICTYSTTAGTFFAVVVRCTLTSDVAESLATGDSLVRTTVVTSVSC